MADFPNYLHFAEDGDGVHPGLIDCVSQELIAVLEDGVLEIDGVARAVELAVAEDKDRIEMLRAQIEGIAVEALDHLQGAMGCTARQHEG